MTLFSLELQLVLTDQYFSVS